MPVNPLLAVSGMAAAIFVAALALAPVPDSAPIAAPPPPPSSSGGYRSLILRGDQYGQFWTTGRVNGVAYRFLVDTGAGETSFGLADARRLGIDPARLVFDRWASTANGTIRTARARVAWLEVGPFVLRDVPVSIGEGDSPALLGMGFLRRYRLVIGRDALTISE
jgi:aspartyl protease family protein